MNVSALGARRMRAGGAALGAAVPARTATQPVPRSAPGPDLTASTLSGGSPRGARGPSPPAAPQI